MGSDRTRAVVTDWLLGGLAGVAPAVVLVLAGLTGLTGAQRPLDLSDAEDRAGRVYHRVTVAGLPRTTWTHVEVEGTVTLVRLEPDGDVHLRLTDQEKRHVVVGEIIPGLPVPPPHVGDRVRVRGIHRYDGRHRWHEVHPIETLEVVGR